MAIDFPNSPAVADIFQAGASAWIYAGSSKWNLYSDSTTIINTQTASYTPVLGDAGRIIEMSVGSANNFTVPLNSTVPYPIGTWIDVIQTGTGQTTIVATGGVTLLSSGSKLKITGQYSAVSLIKRATDAWHVTGDLTT